MNTVEVYVLCKSRSFILAHKFLNQFAPSRECSHEDFPFPEYTDTPSQVYKCVEDVLRELESNQTESYSLYWDVIAHDYLNSVMLFFTDDGGMIAGIAVSEGYETKVINDLTKTVSGEYGYVSYENVPPSSSEEFIRICNSSNHLRVVAGKVLE
ncbi:hypothetical protein [Algicola sagamiensis]|uniref:hypothetical protein n=1 Tax=Algicola sagamiensis TaxID=163869 RepID=UPI00037B264C|nr:hypothetical protein [Algicola sagamiensis]